MTSPAQSPGHASNRNEEEEETEEEILDFDFQEKHETYISSHALLKQAVADLAPITVEEVLQSLSTPENESHTEGWTIVTNWLTPIELLCSAQYSMNNCLTITQLFVKVIAWPEISEGQLHQQLLLLYYPKRTTHACAREC